MHKMYAGSVSTEGKTGIEIQVCLSPGQRTVGKVLSALHLEKLGKWVGNTATAVITVDGDEIEEPLYGAHFIDVTPGKHDVKMHIKSRGPTGIQKALYSATADARGTEMHVVVNPGKVTVLRYTPKDGAGATLEFVDERDLVMKST